jgi:hypothetical protein
MPFDQFRQQIAQQGASLPGPQMFGGQKPDAYNPYAAGPKQYGGTGRNNPTAGPVSGSGRQGYALRDLQIRAKQNAYLSRMKAAQAGDYMSAGGLSMLH